ncbi:serine/threonine-protein kinase HipA [Acinetobacter boissieri]|uniref:Serine/threonine-protein kinase HipA n=2 Tax=Acinetobacter boissieri TaxID=1219383 RepID=A0A1G6GYY3_9GAMM|nr:serine/threonine-protein kinase HipA [Acinetobacter boissieri]
MRMTKTMKILTVQALIHQTTWQDIASLYLSEPEKGSSSVARLEYALDYAIEYLEQRNYYACSLSLPVQMMVQHENKHWFGFLDDLVPSGAARRYWINHLQLQHYTSQQQDSILLEKGVIAPVGHLRIKESIPIKDPNSTLHLRTFELSDVANRHSDFLEYAQQMGAISGGATGAGGEAPKLLIRFSSDEKVWIDTFQERFDQPDLHYLVKFPRNQRTEIDCNILRAEYHYYHALADLGFNTIDVKQMKLIEGEHYPSLWLPRFDTVWIDQQWQRRGLESVYSVLNCPAGSYLNHFEVIESLCQILKTIDSTFKSSDFICEWLQRDLLNIIFGNSDNHGRNTSFLKSADAVQLAPIYDFAPMKADPEGIIRSTSWGSPYEEGGEYRWAEICQHLGKHCPPEKSMQALKDLAQRLVGIKQNLIDRGVPHQIIDMPVLGLSYTENKLKRWQLL